MNLNKIMPVAVLCILIFRGSFSQIIPVDTTANVIMNTRDNVQWIAFARKMEALRNGKRTQITIVHLGDSHIQGGYFTNEFRYLLNKAYGISSRGWVFPYTLAHTDFAEDVAFHSTSKWRSLKYNRIRPFRKVNISGYDLRSGNATVNLSVGLRQHSEILYPFNELRIFSREPIEKVGCNVPDLVETSKMADYIFQTDIRMNEVTDSVNLAIKYSGNFFQILGMELLRNKPGIIYDVLGINGIGYESLDYWINYLPYVQSLHPDCIIVSLGTNDAYVPRLDTAVMKRHIESVIRSLKASNPGACILVTTMGDHLIHKKRLNPLIEVVNNEIISCARAEKCSYWDFFKVMGGIGATRAWARKGLFYKDMIHLSKEGYAFQGDLFFKAMQTSLEKTEYDK